jgi:hypothetical protein
MLKNRAAHARVEREMRGVDSYYSLFRVINYLLE